MVALRTTLNPGDVGTIVALHGTTYAKEYGFDITFEAYVAAPLAAFVLKGSPRERIWIAESDRQIVGCVAIVEERPHVAQLRWFLVAPETRGAGLGRRLLDEAVAFSRDVAYEEIILWTVSALETAARLYRRAGFERVEAIPARRWGVDVVEEKYAMTLRRSRGD